MASLRFRQIHLDFHTSELFTSVGGEFDPLSFAQTLKEAGVNSVTCFSRCHHGWIYHETSFPNRHPHLQRNLLAEQIEACHREGIKVPIYITVGWDHLMATLHPEWTELDHTGRRVGRGPLDDGGGWIFMDFASPYLDYVMAQTQEVCDLFGNEVDGFFFDIMDQQGVHSPHCLARFDEKGWDPRDPMKRQEMRELLVAEACDRLYGAVREKNKDCPVFFNSGHVGPAIRSRLGSYTHLEIESLPNGGWGYSHFPMTVRYARTLGLDSLGMTGKFSETWGHFGSYKNKAALEFECFSALAQGSKCSVGDQLHPSGKLDPASYELIGSVYREVAKVEPWCENAGAVTEIAVLHPEEFDAERGRRSDPALGAYRALVETHMQFDFVDSQCDWSGYSVLVLPDVIPLTPELEDKVEAFMAAGGGVLASHQCLLNTEGEVARPFRSALRGQGGDLPYSPDFVRMAGSITDFVMYDRGLALEAAEGAEILATITEPQFNRTYRAFISHAHGPAMTPTEAPALVVKGQVACLAHPVFTTYARHSMANHRDLISTALRWLLPHPILEAEGLPTSLQMSLTQQGDRWIVHLLHYIPEKRGTALDIVENGLPVLPFTLKARVGARKASLLPINDPLPAVNGDCQIQVEVPGFVGRAMICLAP